MTKEITKAIILQEIEDKFKLRELTPEIFSFLETVIPTYDVQQHLLHRAASYVEVSITATGVYYFHAPPIDERWTFNLYDVVFMGAGAYTVAGVIIKRHKLSDTVYLDLTAAQTVSYHVTLPVPVTLDPGDKIGINIDGYTSTQDLRLYIDYTMEKVR